MSAQTGLSPAPAAMDMVREMIGRDDIKREILEETLSSSKNGQVLESGRTACGSTDRLYGPLGRYPRSVELRPCPRGVAGAFHTHVTASELRSPTLSLADVGIVVFTSLDAIQVTGTNTEEFFVAADDEGRMREVFEDVTGATSVEGVVDSVMSGRLDPASAQSRLRSELSPLFMESNTGYTSYHPEIAEMSPIVPSSPAQYDELEAMLLKPRLGTLPDVEPSNFTERVDMVGRRYAQLFPGDAFDMVKSEAVATTIGLVIGRFVENALFE
jgi:hypothetical protein